jgi:hypothetical protein
MSAGQLVSTIGSRLTGLALGVWVYQTTGSVTRFAMIQLSFWLPIIPSPIAGSLVDRRDRLVHRCHGLVLPAAGGGDLPASRVRRVEEELPDALVAQAARSHVPANRYLLAGTRLVS